MVYVLTREARSIPMGAPNRYEAESTRSSDRNPVTQTHLLEMFAEVLTAVGTPRLYKLLLDALQELATVDDLTILTLDSGAPLQLLGLASRSNTGVLRSLTRDYVAEHHNQDPNFSELTQPTRSRRVLVRRHDFSRLKTKAYQTRFYTSVGVVDKLSYIWRCGRTAYYVNLYRNTASGLYTTAEVQALTSISRFLANLIWLHSARVAVGEAMRHNEGDDLAERLVILLDARLTVRESMVLSRILKGLQTEGIALDLNVKPASVVTFKQRAFSKLGITTQAELFARCITVLPTLAGMGA
jgi:DNA-binding CsgD family transcriptional regulator